MKILKSLLPELFLNFSYITPQYFFKGWDLFFKEEIGYIFYLHLLGIFLSYVFNCFTWCSQWQMTALIILFRRLVVGGICTSTRRLDGKVVIITGSNTGLGEETANELAKRGAKIVMACRNMSKAETVATKLRKNTGGKIVTMKLDLSSLESVRSFVKEFTSEYDTLDILVNNAGVIMCPLQLTTDGFEMHYGVNHLGHFLLTNLLLPSMKTAQEARIISVSSVMHTIAEMDLNDMTYKNGYDRMVAYGNSKLANILFSRALAERLTGSNIKVFSVHPGAIETSLGILWPYGLGYLYKYCLVSMFKTQKAGIQTTIYCATEAESVDHTYYSDCSVGRPSEVAQNLNVASKLWDISEKLVNLEK